MIKRLFPVLKRERRAVVLSIIIVLQALCAMFFFGDVVFDLIEGERLDNIHLSLEAGAAVILMTGVVFLMNELRDLLDRMEVMDVSIRAARGEMTVLFEEFFDKWKLTVSEREIALFVLKGVDNAEIARIRGTAPSTVRAQCTQIYQKAKVDSRAQLLSTFVEELFQVDESPKIKS